MKNHRTGEQQKATKTCEKISVLNSNVLRSGISGLRMRTASRVYEADYVTTTFFTLACVTSLSSGNIQDFPYLS